MSVMEPTLSLTPTTAPRGLPPSKSLSSLVLQGPRGESVIPSGVVDLASFRAWAHSEEFPGHGHFAYLDGLLWVDLNMEELFTHNRVKARYCATVTTVVDEDALGYLFIDGALLTNTSAGVSTEPDACFCLWETARSGRLRFVPGKKSGYMELEGTPDWVLEIVSGSSVKKDTEILPQLYWKAGVPEFWLVDARNVPAQMQIFRHTPDGYQPQPTTDRGVFSPLFKRCFRLTQDVDQLGHAQFHLAVTLEQGGTP